MIYLIVKVPTTDAYSSLQAKLFNSYELKIFIDLVYYALEALDIYTINTTPPGQARNSGLIPRSKEEKEVLEHFSGIVIIK